MNPNSEELFQLPTHLYYFATPKIPIGESDKFDSSRFASLVDHYLVGFAQTVDWLAGQLGDSRCAVWVPSTAFLDENGNEFPNMSRRKACMELLCERLARSWSNISVHYRRLPRLPSDQTQSLVSLDMQDACDVIVDVLRRQR